MHWVLWKTPHLPAETFKLLTIFKTRNGISSFWLASFYFSLGKELSPDAEGWPLAIEKLGLSETFTFKLVYKIGVTQEWGDLRILGKKNSTRWTHMRFLHKQSYFAGMLAKIHIGIQSMCPPEALKIPMDVPWPAAASSTLPSSTSTTTSRIQDERAIGTTMEPQAHNLRVLPTSLSKSLIIQWDAAFSILQYWKNFKFVCGAQSDLVTALKLFRSKDISSVSSLTHSTGSIFAVYNSAASTDKRGGNGNKKDRTSFKLQPLV